MKETIKVEIDETIKKLARKISRIVVATIILMTFAGLLSLLQPIYVLDKIITLMALLGSFEVGILGGIVMTDSVVMDTYKAHTKKEKTNNENL